MKIYIVLLIILISALLGYISWNVVSLLIGQNMSISTCYRNKSAARSILKYETVIYVNCLVYFGVQIYTITELQTVSSRSESKISPMCQRPIFLPGQRSVFLHFVSETRISLFNSDQSSEFHYLVSGTRISIVPPGQSPEIHHCFSDHNIFFSPGQR